MFAEFLLKNETPVFLGGYDTHYNSGVSTEGLRMQSFKGLLRYWLRAYLAGAGMNLNEISSETCKLLGGRVNKEFFASKIQIKSYLIYDKHCTFVDRSFPKVNLMLRSKQKLDCAISLEAKLTINERLGVKLEESEKVLIIGTLLTSLLLSGIGKMNRRGFGTFSVNVQKDDSGLFYKDTNSIFDINTNDEVRKKLIVSIIEKTKKYLNEKTIFDIPPIHAIHRKYLKLIYLPVKKPKNVICDLQRFTLRAERAKILLGHFQKKDEITNEHLAWFLGLPRSQKLREKKEIINETGYIILDKEVQRRPSPLFFSVHKNFALISLFLSKDWPKNLKWIGKYDEVQLNIESDKIQKAYEIIFKSLIKYLDKLGYKYEVIYGG